MMELAIARIKEGGVCAVSVLFEEKLAGFYEKFGFYTMLAGQMETGGRPIAESTPTA